MQLISPETIFRGNYAWQKSLPYITKLTKSPLILGRSIFTNNLRNKIFIDLKNHLYPLCKNFVDFGNYFSENVELD